MTAINFPNSPQVNDVFTVGERSWKWTGIAWDALVTLEVVGPTGPAGPQGPAGADGLTGAEVVATVSYVHNQLSASSSWTVVHNLGFYPNVSAYDSADTMVEGEIIHNDNTTLTINFSASFSGKAHLS